MTSSSNTELLFSYGTLQLESVQQANFGRLLEGQPAAMVGWRKDMLEITDPEVLAESGERFHPIVRQSGDNNDRVEGTVFYVSSDELLKADAYEVSEYHRISVNLISGDVAWVYVAKV